MRSLWFLSHRGFLCHFSRTEINLISVWKSGVPLNLKTGEPGQAATHGQIQTEHFCSPQAKCLGRRYLNQDTWGRSWPRPGPYLPGPLVTFKIRTWPFLSNFSLCGRADFMKSWLFPQSGNPEKGPEGTRRVPEGDFPLRNLERCRSTYPLQISTNFYKFLRILENPEIWAILRFVEFCPREAQYWKVLSRPWAQ